MTPGLEGAIAVGGIGMVSLAAYGYTQRVLKPFNRRLEAIATRLTDALSGLREELRSEISENRELSRERETEHGKELALLTQAVTTLRDSLERQVASADSVQGQLNRVVFQQGKQEVEIATLKERVERMDGEPKRRTRG